MKSVVVDVDNWQDQFELIPPDTGGLVSFEITSASSTRGTAASKALRLSPITFTISNYMDGTTMDLPSGTGSGAIAGTSEISKIESKPCVLEGDNTKVQLVGQHTVPGASPQTVTLEVTVRIKYAGQDKVQTL